ncbi:MAG: glycine cleavage T C-terminal barrel domain-containing protein [Acidobacteriota bacterium]
MTETSKDPLLDLQRSLGADLAPWRGVTAASSYGDPAREADVLRNACGLFLHPSDRLSMSGEDRTRFLNGQVTCEIADRASGAGTYGFFVTPKGRIEADVTVLVDDDRLWLDLPPGQGDGIRARLEKYKIVDRVEVEAESILRLSLMGPGAEGLLDGVDTPAEPFGHGSGEVDGSPVQVVRARPLGVTTVDLWVRPEHLGAVFEALRGRGAEPVGWRALDTVRVEAGVPLWGADFGLEHFPKEIGLEEAISYTKGCYLGQEVVARIHYRGGVKKHLRGLRFEGPAPAPGAAVRLDGRKVGEVGTAAHSEILGGAFGLAVIHDRAAPGSTVEVGGEAEGPADSGATRVHAEVVELPFAPRA